MASMKGNWSEKYITYNQNSPKATFVKHEHRHHHHHDTRFWAKQTKVRWVSEHDAWRTHIRITGAWRSHHNAWEWQQSSQAREEQFLVVSNTISTQCYISWESPSKSRPASRTCLPRHQESNEMETQLQKGNCTLLLRMHVRRIDVSCFHACRRQRKDQGQTNGGRGISGKYPGQWTWNEHSLWVSCCKGKTNCFLWQQRRHNENHRRIWHVIKLWKRWISFPRKCHAHIFWPSMKPAGGTSVNENAIESMCDLWSRVKSRTVCRRNASQPSLLPLEIGSCNIFGPPIKKKGISTS